MIIGRDREQEILHEAFLSNSSIFLAIYGRRRVGKTHLVREFFQGKDAVYFEVTGRKGQPLEVQLRTFTESYSQVYLNSKHCPPFESWHSAFQTITSEIQRRNTSDQPAVKKHVLFFDELAWLANNDGTLLSELDHFWNTKWSTMKNVRLIVCGSAASWMIRNIINAKGGLYNRLTNIIHLKPFSLSETKKFLEFNNISMEDHGLIELYLALGGIPHYLKLVDKNFSVAQNINALFFGEHALLQNEYERLFESLFDSAEDYHQVIQTLASTRKGMLRTTLQEKTDLSEARLVHVLKDLSASSFIKSYVPFGKKKRDSFYRIIDEFCLFHLSWIENLKDKQTNRDFWISEQQSNRWTSWAGYSFEGVVEKHSQNLLQSLGISGIQSIISKWKFRGGGSEGLPGAEIDLLIDRADNIINVCEIKFNKQPYAVTKKSLEEQRSRLSIFKAVTKTRKSLVPILISANGALRNQYLDSFAIKVLDSSDIIGKQ